jgi:cell division protein FtsW (lipid II flippase)
MDIINIDLNAHIEPAYMLLVFALAYGLRDLVAAQIKGNNRMAVLIIAAVAGVAYWYILRVSVLNLVVSYSLVTTCYDLIVKRFDKWLNSQASQ